MTKKVPICSGWWSHVHSPISLTPRFNAGGWRIRQKKNRFKRFLSRLMFSTRLKPGVNENVFYSATFLSAG